MNFTEMSDEAILKELGNRIQRERLNQNITQALLARRAGISHRALQRLELGDNTTLATMLRVLRMLGMLDQLDLFLPDPGYSPVQLADLEGKVRERATAYRVEKKRK